MCGEGEQVMRQRVRKDLVDVESWTRRGALHMPYNDELNEACTTPTLHCKVPRLILARRAI